MTKYSIFFFINVCRTSIEYLPAHLLLYIYTTFTLSKGKCGSKCEAIQNAHIVTIPVSDL